MAGIKQYHVQDPYIKCANSIGESIHYEARTKTVSWIDIGRDELHIVALDQGPSSHKTVLNLKTRPHKNVDLSHNEDLWLIGGKYGIGLMNKSTGESRFIKQFPIDKSRADGLQSNDGAVDSAGRFWVGTMSDPIDFTKFEGSLWRFDPDFSLHEVHKGSVGIANGISWSKDDKTMYWTDSTKTKIFAYDFDAATGEISNERAFYEGRISEQGTSVPDGHAMDEDGFMWVALYGGSKVIRLSPQGELVAEVLLPTSNITDVAFVNEDIFISTARTMDQPETSGHLYRCHVGIKGRPLNKFLLSKEFLASKEARL